MAVLRSPCSMGGRITRELSCKGTYKSARRSRAQSIAPLTASAFVSARDRGGRHSVLAKGHDHRRVRERHARVGRRSGPAVQGGAPAERARHAIPNDSIVTAGPRRGWAATSRLAKPGTGRCTSTADEARRLRGSAALSLATTSAPRSRANALAKLQASHIRLRGRRPRNNRRSLDSFSVR